MVLLVEAAATLPAATCVPLSASATHGVPAAVTTVTVVELRLVQPVASVRVRK